MADALLPVVGRTADPLLAGADHAGALNWSTFRIGWRRMAREIVLGRAAAGDDALDRFLDTLRADANRSVLKPVRRHARERSRRAVLAHLDRAEPGSLAARVPAATTPDAVPVDQVAHWLFAWDATGIGTFRALAVLASLPGYAQQVRDEASVGSAERPFARACLLDTLRLWPTTPAILRETDRGTDWSGAAMPKGTGLLIDAPFLHRDDRRWSYADRFAPGK